MPRMHFKGGAWTNAEDEVLRSAFAQYGLLAWERIASTLTRKTAAQCRERWEAYLDPRLNIKEAWSMEEEEKLVELQTLFPNQWHLISQQLPRMTKHTHHLRPPWLCEERYHQLKDELEYSRSVAHASPADGGRTPTMEEFMAERARRRAAHQPHEEKAARADTVGGDTFEKETIDLARSRLANQDQKKGLRKERQRQLEEASFLAKLENHREAVESGTQSLRQAHKMAKAMEEDRDGAPRLRDGVHEDEDEDDDDGEVGPSSSFTPIDMFEDQQQAGIERKKRKLVVDLGEQQQRIARQEDAARKEHGGAPTARLHGSSSESTITGINHGLLEQLARPHSPSSAQPRVKAAAPTTLGSGTSWDALAGPSTAPTNVDDLLRALPGVEPAQQQQQQQREDGVAELLLGKLPPPQPTSASSSSSAAAAAAIEALSSLPTASVIQQHQAQHAATSTSAHADLPSSAPSPRAPAAPSSSTGGASIHIRIAMDEAEMVRALHQARKTVAIEVERHHVATHSRKRGRASDDDDDDDDDVVEGATASDVAAAKALVAQHMKNLPNPLTAADVAAAQKELHHHHHVGADDAIGEMEIDVSQRVAAYDETTRAAQHVLDHRAGICLSDPGDAVMLNYFHPRGALMAKDGVCDGVVSGYLRRYWQMQLAHHHQRAVLEAHRHEQERCCMKQRMDALQEELVALTNRERVLQDTYREAQRQKRAV